MTYDAASYFNDAVASRDVVNAAFKSLAGAPPAAADGNARYKLNALNGDAFVFMGVSLKDEFDVISGEDIDKIIGAFFVELRCNGEIFRKTPPASSFDIG